jgi:hypothetical protein
VEGHQGRQHSREFVLKTKSSGGATRARSLCFIARVRVMHVLALYVVQSYCLQGGGVEAQWGVVQRGSISMQRRSLLYLSVNRRLSLESFAAPRVTDGMVPRVAKICYRLIFSAHYLSVNRRFLGRVWEVGSPGECGTVTTSDLIYVGVGENEEGFPRLLIAPCMVPPWYDTHFPW